MNPKPVRLDQVRHHWEIYLFVIPTVLLVALFQYYPASSGIFHSFFRWNGADISEFRILENYIDLLRNTEFWNSFKLAFFLGAWNIAKMIPALLAAVCIHRCRNDRMQFIYRALFVVPMVIPGLVVVLIWRSFFFEATAGYLNRFLISSGLFDVLCRLDQLLHWGGVFLPGRMPAWLGDPKLIIAACVIWGFPWVGSFAVLTHLAKLQGISKDIYEAAEIDGVNWWTKFTKVELPLIMGSIYLLLVFVIIDTIKDAGMIYALAGIQGGPGGVATVPALFMARKAFLDQQMGYACAVGIVLTLVVMALQKASNLIAGSESRDERAFARFRVLSFIAGSILMYFGFYIAGTVFVVLALPRRALLDHVAVRRGEWVARGLLLAGAALVFALGWGSLAAGGIHGAVVPRILALQQHLLGLAAQEGVAPLRKDLLTQASQILGVFVWPGPAAGFNAYLGALCLVFGIPFGNGLKWLRSLSGPRSVERRSGRSPADLHEERAFARLSNPACRFFRALGSGSLRFGKHFYIWLVLAFAFLPLYLMIIVSVKNNEQFYLAPATVTQPMFWENWRTAWDMVTPTVANSLYISVSSTLMTLGLALCGAYFFARLKMPGHGFLWNALLLLMMMPAIANLVPLFILLRNMNLLNTLTALIVVGASGGQIFGIFVLRNFIQDTPQDLFDAAEIDGAGHFQQLRNIVIPLSGPILGTVGVMHFISAWNDFFMPLIIMRDHSRLPVMVQLLRMAGEYIKLWGPLMAGYAIASIPIIILFVFSMKLFIRGLTEGAIKG